jgi:hypothetical protein
MRAGLEGDQRATKCGGARRLEQRIDADIAGESLCPAFCGWLRAVALQFHRILLWPRWPVLLPLNLRASPLGRSEQKFTWGYLGKSYFGGWAAKPILP